MKELIIEISLDFFAIIIFILPFSFIFTLYTADLSFVTLTFFQAWQTDNGGLFFGKAFGKRKLAPAISPKKTMEGLFGAFFLSFATAML